MRPSTRAWLLWIAALAYIVIAFNFAVDNEVIRVTQRSVHKAQPYEAVEHELPLGVIRLALKVRRHLPVYGSFGSWLIRKAGSVLIFGTVGYVAILLSRRGRPLDSNSTWIPLAAATGFSALVEWLQWPEEFGDIALDIGCGVLGGALAALLAHRLANRRT